MKTLKNALLRLSLLTVVALFSFTATRCIIDPDDMGYSDVSDLQYTSYGESSVGHTKPLFSDPSMEEREVTIMPVMPGDDTSMEEPYFDSAYNN